MACLYSSTPIAAEITVLQWYRPPHWRGVGKLRIMAVAFFSQPSSLRGGYYSRLHILPCAYTKRPISFKDWPHGLVVGSFRTGQALFAADMARIMEWERYRNMQYDIRHDRIDMGRPAFPLDIVGGFSPSLPRICRNSSILCCRGVLGQGADGK
jgi:hypothetical protein